MPRNKELVRKNIYMSKDIAKFYEEYSKKIGITQSSLMVMALKTYMDQMQAIEVAKNVPEWLMQIQEIKEG